MILHWNLIVYVNIAFVEEDPMVTLQAIIEESYSGEIGDQMLEMLATLTAEDYRQFTVCFATACSFACRDGHRPRS